MRLRKQIRAFGLIFLIIIFLLDLSNHYIIQAKAASFDEINHPDVFLKQVNGDMQCTLVASTMLVRRASMLLGNSNWQDITVEQMKKQAWVDGVGIKYTFTYDGITVNKAKFGDDPVNEAITLLQEHPEGIVLYDQFGSSRSHAVLLTDYTNEMFYCADPSDGVPHGRIPINEGLVQIKNADYYYYVSSPTIPVVAPSLDDEKINHPLTDLSTYEVELSQTDYYYDGNEKRPEVIIPGLVENIDYTLSYINNVYPGNAAVIIIGKGACSGIIIKCFTIREATIYDYFNEISVDITKKSIKTGKTATIQAIIPESLILVKEFSSDEQGFSNEVKISYSSSNNKIAKVNSVGKVTGKKKGKATIDVTAELADGAKRVFTVAITVK